MLQRADALAVAIASEPGERVPVEERPGYLAPESGSDLGLVVDRLKDAQDPITFVVGAGASMEAGLPSWASLVRKLVEDTAPNLPDLDRAAWLEAVEDSGLLAAAMIARALSAGDDAFRELLWHRLYDETKPGDYQPGPLTQELAAFAISFPSDVELVTFELRRFAGARAAEPWHASRKPR